MRVASCAPSNLLASPWLPLAAVLVAMARCEEMRVRCRGTHGRKGDSEAQRKAFRERAAPGKLAELMQVELALIPCLPGKLPDRGDPEADRAYLGSP